MIIQEEEEEQCKYCWNDHAECERNQVCIGFMSKEDQMKQQELYTTMYFGTRQTMRREKMMKWGARIIKTLTSIAFVAALYLILKEI